MRGERVTTATLDRSGMVGDRRFALVSSAAPVGKPLVTSRERASMLLYQPLLEPRPVVLTPTGEELPLPSAALVERLQGDIAAPNASLELQHSPARPLTDVRPLSFVARATLTFLQQQLGNGFTPQRLRNNLILDLEGNKPFAEEELSGRRFQCGEGSDAPVLQVLERVPRCRMVTLDPETTAADPALLRWLATHRQGRVAMYATVLQPGILHQQDSVQILR